MANIAARQGDNMSAIPLDTLAYIEKLKAVGFTEAQAVVQVELMHQQSEAQRIAFQAALEKYEESSRRELATRGDVLAVKLEIEKVRAEVERVRASIKESETHLLKWQIGIGFAIVSVMAAGF